MGPTIEEVGYGAPADAALAAAVARVKAGDPLAPVTVIVPTNYVGVAARRRLAAAAPGLAAVAFLTIYRLAELLGAPDLAGAGRRPVSTPVVGAAVRRALGRDPGVFAPVRDHPATEQALVRAHRELRQLTPADLDAVARTSPRARDVVRLHRSVTTDLAGSWYDETDLVEAAVAAVARPVPLVRSLGTVIVHLPQDLSAPDATLLAAVSAVAPVHVVAGLTGRAGADAGVRRGLAALGAAGVGAEPAAPTRAGGGAEPAVAPIAAELSIVSTSDADEEVRAAVRAIVAAARDGTPLDRMAVCYAAPDPYARLVAEHLAAAGITRNGSTSVHLRERVAPRVLLGLLDVADHGYSRQAVFELLATAPIRARDRRRIPAATWERRSREAGVVAGLPQWDERLARLAHTLRDGAGRLDDDPDIGPDSGAARAKRRQADEAEALREFVLDLAARLDPNRRPQRWSAAASWARRLLTDLLGDPDSRARWPDAERRAADSVDALLERLAGLDEIDPDVTPEVFRRTVELELDADLGREGRLGEGVFVGPIGLALGQRPELLVVVGLAEGSFPARPADDPLLPDRDRAVAGGRLPLAAERPARQQRQLLAAVAGSRRALLCVPRGDLRQSVERLPSRFVVDVLTAAGVAPAPSRADLAHADLTVTVASFAAGVAAVDFPATAQDHRLRALCDHDRAGRPAEAHPAVADDGAARRGARLARNRASEAFTVYDGNLAGVAVPSPFSATQVISPTRLEDWVACPLGYFVRSILGVLAVEDPEDLLVISALDKGSLLHAVLDGFCRAVLARPAAERPGPDDAWTAADEQLLLEVFAAEANRYEELGLTGRELFWGPDRRELQRALRRFLGHDSRRRRADVSMLEATELRFGLPGATVPAVEVTLGDGRSVRFRGSADRIDRTDDGRLLVVDYKTGRVPAKKDRPTQDDPTLGGRKLQLPVYALAARAAVGAPDAEVRAEYWYVSAPGAEATTVALTVDDDVLARFTSTLTEIADGITDGVFVARPRAPGYMHRVECRYCDPDGLGTTAQHRRWEHKKHDPALAAYLGLVEPEPAS